MGLPNPTEAMHLARNGDPLDPRQLLIDGHLNGKRLGELMDSGAALYFLG